MGRHDRAFRSLMNEEGATQALLEAMLPRRFLRRVVGAPQRMPEHFVDEALRVGVADQLLRWRLRGGRAAYVYCIVEHKRTRERFGLLQLLRYQALLYARLAKHAKKDEQLPMVVTLVVFNGATRWQGPRRFTELTRPPPELRRYALDFEVLLLDLGATRVERLTRHSRLKGGLLALKTAAVPTAAQAPLVHEALRLLREDPSTLETCSIPPAVRARRNRERVPTASAG
ncbi:MAG: Rpn family recombination-promoting nuclease/putative transposase [Myxococcota bacterium]